jgi:hypothetical protein
MSEQALVPCWACKREVPNDHSYSLGITERWKPYKISLGVVICIDCRFKVSSALAGLYDYERRQRATDGGEGEGA